MITMRDLTNPSWNFKQELVSTLEKELTVFFGGTQSELLKRTGVMQFVTVYAEVVAIWLDSYARLADSLLLSSSFLEAGYPTTSDAFSNLLTLAEVTDESALLSQNAMLLLMQRLLDSVGSTIGKENDDGSC